MTDYKTFLSEVEFEASDLDGSLASGAAISTWNSKAGGFVATSLATAVTLVKNVINGKSVARFPGGGRFSTTFVLPSTESFSYMAVVRPGTVAAGSHTIIGGGAANNGVPQWILSAGKQMLNSQNVVNLINPGTQTLDTMAANTPYLLSLRYTAGGRYRTALVDRTYDGTVISAAYWATNGSGVNRWISTSPSVGSPTWLRVEPLVETIPTSYNIRPGDVAWLGRAPKDWKVQGSDDGSSWTDVDVRSGVTTGWTALTPRNFTVTGASYAYRYYRLIITATVSDPSYSEVGDFNINPGTFLARTPAWEVRINGATASSGTYRYDTPWVFTASAPMHISSGPGGTTETLTGDIAYLRVTKGELDRADLISRERALMTAYGLSYLAAIPRMAALSRLTASSDAGSSWYEWYLTNGVAGDGGNAWNAAANPPQSVLYGLSPARVLVSYSITVRSTDASTYPTTFKIQGSNDEGASWTDLDTRTGLSWTAGETKSFTIPSPPATQWALIRWLITASSSGWPGAAEMPLYVPADARGSSSGTWAFAGAAHGDATDVSSGTAPSTWTFAGAAAGARPSITAYDAAILADLPVWALKGKEVLSDFAADSGSAAWPWRYSTATVNLAGVDSDGGTAAAPSLLTGGLLGWKSYVPAALQGANVSIAFWADLPAGNVQGILAGLGTGGTGGPDGWGVSIGAGALNSPGHRLCIHTNGFSFGDTGYTLPSGKVHIVVVQGASRAITAYVNGVSVYTGTLHASLGPAVSYMSIGEALSTSIKIDNAAFFASALSAARVTAQYNGGNGSNAAVAADSPVAWIKVDERTYEFGGTTLGDASGNARTRATIVNLSSPGGPPPLAPMGGKSIGFVSTSGNGSTTGISHVVVSSPTWAQTLGIMSAEVWFRTRSLNGLVANVLLSMDDVQQAPANSLRKFNLYLDSGGRLNWQDYTTAGGTPIATVPTTNWADGNWHHVVVTRDATTIRLYIDGNTTPAATVAIGGTIKTTTTSDLKVGAVGYNGGSGWAFKGEIARPALYDTALSSTRVNAHYIAANVVTGGASGTWQFTGGAVGAAPDLTSDGSASGTWSFVGVAPGKKRSKGRSTGLLAFGGAALGKKGAKGQGSKKPGMGGLAGGWSFLGQAIGKTPHRATATGAWRFLGLAAGGGPPKSFGQWNFVGAAAGDAPTFEGTATGHWSFEGATTGEAGSQGSATGAWAYRGEAMGEVASLGFASGEWFFDGIASGDAAEAFAMGHTFWDGEAVGLTNTPQGQSFGAAWHFTGYAEGAAPQSALVAGDWFFEGAAEGASPRTGEVSGDWLFEGVAVGYVLMIGEGSGDTMWEGFVIGQPDENRTLWADRTQRTLIVTRGSRVSTR